MTQLILSSAAVSDLMGRGVYLPPQYHDMLYHWSSQQAIYEAANSLWTGAALRTRDNSKQRSDGSAPYLYPLRINVWRWAINIQSLFLWGVDNANRVELFSFDSSPIDLLTDGSSGDKLSAAFVRLFTNTNAWAKIREAGRSYFAFGGHYIGIMPSTTSIYGFEWRSLPAHFCFPIFSQGNRLEQLFIAYYIDKEQARSSGVITDSDALLRVEKWDKDGVTVFVDDQMVEQKKFSVYDPVTGDKIFAWSYIPRLRSTSFYGLSLIEDLAGIGQEYNARLADMGDAIAGSTKLLPWMRNVTTNVGNLYDRESGEVVNLGSEVTGKPELGVLEPIRVVDSAREHIERIRDEYLEKALISKVTIGEDEGSQRSGETLAIRALPTIAHAQDCQSSWQEAITNMCNVILNIANLPLSLKALGSQHRIIPKFEPIMPKDLSAMASIASSMRGAEIMSRKLGVEFMGIAHDPSAEAAQIQAEMEQQQQAALDIAMSRSAMNSMEDAEPSQKPSQSASEPD